MAKSKLEKIKSENTGQQKELRELSAPELPGVPKVQARDRLPRSLGDGSKQTPETEALEFSLQFEREFDFAPEDVRPCVAWIFYQGVVGEREPSAFLVALELHTLGVSGKRLVSALEDYSDRLAKPLMRAVGQPVGLC